MDKGEVKVVMRKPIEGKGNQNMRSGDPKVPLFYGVSLLLSLIIVVISVTVFIIAVYFEGRADRNFFILFIAIISINLLVAVVSLWQLMKSFLEFSEVRNRQRIYLARQEVGKTVPQESMSSKLTEEYFTGAELHIINLLKANGNRMLQNAIVSSMGTSKASISRVITSLEVKGVVIRVRKGVTNDILLSETYSH